MEKIKNVFSPGHAADDEVMYGTGKSTVAEGTTTDVTKNPVNVEGSDHAQGKTAHHATTADSGFHGREHPSDITHDFAAPDSTQQSKSQTTTAYPDDRVGSESSEQARKSSWDALRERDHKVTQGPFGEDTGRTQQSSERPNQDIAQAGGLASTSAADTTRQDSVSGGRQHHVTQGPFGEDNAPATGAAAPYSGPKGTAEPLPEMQEETAGKDHKTSKVGAMLGAIGLGSLAKKEHDKDHDESKVEERQSRGETTGQPIQSDSVSSDHSGSKAGAILGHPGIAGGTRRKSPARDPDTELLRDSTIEPVPAVPGTHNEQHGTKAGAILGTRGTRSHEQSTHGSEHGTKTGAILGTGAATHHSDKTEQTRETPVRDSPIGVAVSSPHQGTTSHGQTTDQQIGQTGGYTAQQTPHDTSRTEDSHTGRNTALAAAAAAGAGGVGAHEFSKHDAEKQEEARIAAIKAQEKDLRAHDKDARKEQEKVQKEHEKEQHAHDKAVIKDHEKAEKEHEKEARKEEKEHEKAVKKEEKEHDKAIKKEEKAQEKAVIKEEKKAEKEHEKAVKKEEKEHDKAVKQEEKHAEKEHEKAIKAEKKDGEKSEKQHDKAIIAQTMQAEKDHKREAKHEEKLEKDHSDGEGKKKGGILGIFKRDKHHKDDKVEEEDHTGRNIAAGTAGAAVVGAGAYAGSKDHDGPNKLHKDPPADYASKNQTYAGDKATPAHADYAVMENDHPGAQTITGGYTAPAPKDDSTKTTTHSEREHAPAADLETIKAQHSAKDKTPSSMEPETTQRRETPAQFLVGAGGVGHSGTASSADHSSSGHSGLKDTTTTGQSAGTGTGIQQDRGASGAPAPATGGAGYTGTASSADYSTSGGHTGVQDTTTTGRWAESQQARDTASQYPPTAGGAGYVGTSSSADYTPSSHTQTDAPKSSTLGDPSISGVTALPSLPDRTAGTTTSATQDTSGVGFAHPSNAHSGAAKQGTEAESFDGPVMERPRGTEVEGQGAHMPGEYPEKI